MLILESGIYTPNLDRFAKEDAVSLKCFLSDSVWCSSRCSFFTGLYPHVRGHRLCHICSRRRRFFFKELKNAGYYVWMNPRNDFCRQGKKEFLKNIPVNFLWWDVKEAPNGRIKSSWKLDGKISILFILGN